MATMYQSTGETVSASAAWRRAYRVQVYVDNTSSKAILDVSQLRVVFNVNRNALFAANAATIQIYNLNAETEKVIIEEGYRVTVEAGYDPQQTGKSGLYGQIFDGTVVMCNRWKENGTDYVLQILAMDGSQFIYSSFASLSFEKNSTARQIIKNLANTATTPIEIGYISPVFDQMTMQKGGAHYGLPKNTLSDFAKSKNGTWYVDNGKLYVIAYSDSTFLPEGKEAVLLTPQTGLIGVPEQIDQGVKAKMLLNSMIVPYGLVHIPSYLVKRQLTSVDSASGTVGTIYGLDHYEIYRVISVAFTGDSRGNDWYTEITTVSQVGSVSQNLTYN